MIEMGDRQVQRKGRDDLAQEGKEGQRIGAARDGDHDALSRFEDVVQRDRDGDAPGKHHGNGGGKDRTCDIPGMGRLLYH